MTRFLLAIFMLLTVSSCVVKKKTTYGKERKVSVAATPTDTDDSIAKEKPSDSRKEVIVPKKADNIINTAMSFSGVRYKFGGTTRRGMDCSGLLYVAFGQHNVSLPRVSYQMANQGRRIKVGKVTKGDLLFFKTTRKGKRINHVGLVVAVENDEIKFIHSTSSRGVIVSSLREGYWNYAFVKATRVL